MKITYFRGRLPNFGDELNAWLWPQLLPGFFDDDEEVAFFGIGSIIGMEAPFAARRIVFGAGFVPDYFEKPDMRSQNWDISFVRGPRTAELLNLPPETALGDAAILVRTLPDLPLQTAQVVSFMPHWESAERGNWARACQLAGINYIDPTRPVSEVMAQLSRSRLVLAEAMHGAIVADALRIPWIALRPIGPWHRDKWLDWAQAFDIDLQAYPLWPSSFDEAALVLMQSPFYARVARVTKRVLGPGLAEKIIAHFAAYRLWQVARQPGQLSSDEKIDSVTAAMLAKLAQLRVDYRQNEAEQTGPLRA